MIDLDAWISKLEADKERLCIWSDSDEMQLRMLRELRASRALREGVAYAYHGPNCGVNCEMCRVVAKYDKDVADGK